MGFGFWVRGRGTVVGGGDVCGGSGLSCTAASSAGVMGVGDASPLRVRGESDAPARISASTAARSPMVAAQCSGARPSASARSTSAPDAMSVSSTPTGSEADAAAYESAVRPAASCAFASAPACMRDAACPISTG